jgi:magnesium transporter
MPLSFITGIYGMNFNPGASKWNMPELNWRYGYPAVLVVLWVLALAMLAFFYRKGWLKSFAPMSPPADGPEAGHS